MGGCVRRQAVALVLSAVTLTVLILTEPPTMAQGLIYVCSVIATHPAEGSPVGAAEVMHETTLPEGPPGPSTRAQICS